MDPRVKPEDDGVGTIAANLHSRADIGRLMERIDPRDLPNAFLSVVILGLDPRIHA